MSDSNLHQNTSENQDVQESAPATTGTTGAEGVTGEGEHKSKTFTRRSVLAMAGCGVAGLVVGGVLASWGVTSKSIASGRIEIRTTPTKMIVTDRARCSGCQRCEMMCTLKNDGRVSQHIARVRVWDNYNFGSGVDTNDGIFGNCQFTVASCKQCADPQCAKYCPYDFILICRKEKKVSILSTHCLYQRIHLFFLHKFCKRRFYCAIFLDRNVCKSLCAVIFRKAYQFINFLSRHTSLTFGIDTTNSSALLDCPFEHNKLTIFYNFCHILKFHAKTGIRFIRAITIHCFLPCHSRNRKCYFLS